MPFTIIHIGCKITPILIFQFQVQLKEMMRIIRRVMLILTHLESVICPTSKLHFAFLIIKWEPGNVYFTCWFKDSRWNVGATPFIGDHNIGRVGSVESLISTWNIQKKISFKTEGIYIILNNYVSTNILDKPIIHLLQLFTFVQLY